MPRTNTIEVTAKKRVLFNGELIGTVEVIGRNLRRALNVDGEVVVEACYANGGADYTGAFLLAIRTGHLKNGMRHVNIDKIGNVIAGPYTYDANL
jgi:hypothetical protein